mmetsp:Transcript_40693/g.79267  ORF Transcript_40693/g.79267 Transcript_40693/m.79267 type:complete len:549 (+) Transcript_40693:72-1718(+)
MIWTLVAALALASAAPSTVSRPSTPAMRLRSRFARAGAAAAAPRPLVRPPGLAGSSSLRKSPVAARAEGDVPIMEERSAALMIKRQISANRSDEENFRAANALEQVLSDIRDLSSRRGMKGPSMRTVFMTVVAAMATSLVSPYVFTHHVAGAFISGSAATIFAASSSAECQGGKATAEAKEIACVALAKAARAEVYVSRAEKARAIIPYMIGVSASAATFNLIFPGLMKEIDVNPVFIALWPIIATAAAAVSAGAVVETLAMGLQALGFSPPDRVLSVREATTDEKRLEVASQRLIPVLKATVPGIAVGALYPGAFVTKCILSSAVAAVTTAYAFAEAEAVCGECATRVANIAKASAKAEALANDALAQSAVLPFTSAIAGLALASTAAMVEIQLPIAAVLPMVGAIAAGMSRQAAVKSQQDANDARLAFKDDSLRKFVPAEVMPDLAWKVIPDITATTVLATAKMLVNMIRVGPEESPNDLVPASRRLEQATGRPVFLTQKDQVETDLTTLETMESNRIFSVDPRASGEAAPERQDKASRFVGGLLR